MGIVESAWVYLRKPPVKTPPTYAIHSIQQPFLASRSSLLKLLKLVRLVMYQSKSKFVLSSRVISQKLYRFTRFINGEEDKM